MLFPKCEEPSFTRIETTVNIISNTVIPRFTSLIRSSKTARKAKTRQTKIHFPLLPMLYILIGSRGQTFLPIHSKFALVQHLTVPKYEKNTLMVNYCI
jgi:hypothetical protein